MRVRYAAIAAVALLAVAPAARAQEVREPVSRADVSVTLGWLNAKKTDVNSLQGRNDWYNKSVYGGASVGWYWTDHWKTEIEGGASSRAEFSAYSLTAIDGRNVSLQSNYRFATRRLTIGQQYQFNRNAWAHPFVGVGVDLTWEQQDRRDEFYGVLPTRTTPHPRRTEQLVRPFAIFGVKAYVAPHAFFRADVKAAIREGVDEMLLRIGLGVDF